MKAVKSLLVAFLALSMAGCITGHRLPKDSYMRGVKSEINTPWGSHKLELDEVATGKAAEKAGGK